MDKDRRVIIASDLFGKGRSREYYEAIGYLAQFAPRMYDEVRIYFDASAGPEDNDHPDLIAHYRNSDCGLKTVIGVVWNNDKQQYGYHS